MRHTCKIRVMSLTAPKQRLDSHLFFTFTSSGFTVTQTFADSDLFITLSIVRLIDPARSLLKPNS